jgi:hypothetical protein
LYVNYIDRNMSGICRHVGTRGNSAGVKCHNRANHGLYCVRHKKKTVSTDLSRDEVFGSEKAAPAPATAGNERKQRFSTYRWTVNSQKDLSGMSAEQKQRFKRAIEFVFNEATFCKYMVDRTSPEDPCKNAGKMKIEYYFEVGEQQHRLHVHGVVDLAHYGNYQIQVDKVRAVLERILGYKVHFNCQGSANSEAAWKAYIQKKQEATEVQL